MNVYIQIRVPLFFYYKCTKYLALARVLVTKSQDEHGFYYKYTKYRALARVLVTKSQDEHGFFIVASA